MVARELERRGKGHGHHAARLARRLGAPGALPIAETESREPIAC